MAGPRKNFWEVIQCGKVFHPFRRNAKAFHLGATLRRSISAEVNARRTTMVRLCPAQQKAFDSLMESLPIGNIFVVWSQQGMGRTTILQELHRLKGGDYLTMKDY